MIWQKEIQLPAFKRGFHLITNIIEKELADLPGNGLLHLFIKHTSAGLSINENADSDVRTDFESFFNHLVPERMPFYVHTLGRP
jgi:secondary thiamine-phosphate synthase enzyme